MRLRRSGRRKETTTGRHCFVDDNGVLREQRAERGPERFRRYGPGCRRWRGTIGYRRRCGARIDLVGQCLERPD